MNLESAPRLPKLPFLIGDVVLLLIAAVLAMLSPRPLDTSTVVTIALLVALGAALLVTPFILDYAASTTEAVERERQRVSEQTTRLHDAIDSLTRAVAQIKAVEEAVHKAAREAETLPYRMQEKLAEFNDALAAKEETDHEALESELAELRAGHGEKLKLAAEKVAKATAELAALEVAARQQLAATEASHAKLQQAGADAAAHLEQSIARATRELDAKLREMRASAAELKAPPPPPAARAAPQAVAQSADSPPPAEPVNPPAESPVVAPDAPSHIASPAADAAPTAAAASPSATETPADHSATPVEITPTPAPSELANGSAGPGEIAKPRKPRTPRKPKPEESLLAISATPPTPPAAPVAEPAETPAAAPEFNPPAESAAGSSPDLEPAPELDDSATPAAAARAESSSSSDGATRLLATAYIGIGNKLFIRGDGPGLSWDRGVPMQFVSIGKWGWFTHDAAGPIRCKLYKNDETAALTGDITLESGRHTEVTALF